MKSAGWSVTSRTGLEMEALPGNILLYPSLLNIYPPLGLVIIITVDTALKTTNLLILGIPISGRYQELWNTNIQLQGGEEADHIKNQYWL